MRQLRIAMLLTGAGLFVTLLLLIRETPHTFTAFMFLAQPLLFLGMVLLIAYAIAELRGRGVF